MLYIIAMGNLHYYRDGEEGYSVTLALTSGADGDLLLNASVLPPGSLFQQGGVSVQFLFTKDFFGDKAEDAANRAYKLIVDQLNVVGYRYLTELSRAVRWLTRLVLDEVGNDCIHGERWLLA